MPVIDEDEAEDYEEPDDDNEDEESEDGAVISLDEHLIAEATALVRAENKATASLLQRRLNVGYSKAAQIMDELEARGVIGAYNGSAPREVLPADVPEEQ